MLILGIETSCDETAAALVKDGREILSNVVASSANIHKETGGIIPEQAARQQVISLVPVIEEALARVNGGLWTVNRKPKTLNTNIDAIAVTVGPGLIGSLLVGVQAAKTLSYLWKKPIVPVNHLGAHIYANWLDDNSKLKTQSSKLPKFPALALVVSGGHTDLVLMKNHGNLKWIGGTRDDAAGEAFDKSARLLGLPYPGGPSISSEAEKFLATHNSPLTLFPRPMIGKKNLDWSFSGLKTAVLREVESNPTTLKLRRTELAAQVQEAIVEVLVKKTLMAVKKHKPKSLLLAGGVAANKRLRQKFKEQINELTNQRIDFHVPPSELCTDNATYIASYAFFNYQPVAWEKVQANPQLTIVGGV